MPVVGGGMATMDGGGGDGDCDGDGDGILERATPVVVVVVDAGIAATAGCSAAGVKSGERTPPGGAHRYVVVAAAAAGTTGSTRSGVLADDDGSGVERLLPPAPPSTPNVAAGSNRFMRRTDGAPGVGRLRQLVAVAEGANVGTPCGDIGPHAVAMPLGDVYVLNMTGSDCDDDDDVSKCANKTNRLV